MWVWGKESNDYTVKDVPVKPYNIGRLSRLYPIFTTSPHNPTFVKRHIEEWGDIYVWATVIDIDAHEIFKVRPPEVAIWEVRRAAAELTRRNNLLEINPNVRVVFTGRGVQIWLPFVKPVPLNSVSRRFLGRLNEEILDALDIPPPLQGDILAARDFIRPYRLPATQRDINGIKFRLYEIPASPHNITTGDFYNETGLLIQGGRPIKDVEEVVRELGELYREADGQRNELFLEFIGEMATAGVDIEEVERLYREYLLPHDSEFRYVRSAYMRARERIERGEPVKRLPYALRLTESNKERVRAGQDVKVLVAGRYMQDREGIYWGKELILRGLHIHRIQVSGEELRVLVEFRGETHEVAAYHPAIEPKEFNRAWARFGFSTRQIRHIRGFIESLLEEDADIVIREGMGRLYWDGERYIFNSRTAAHRFKPLPRHMFGFLDFQNAALIKDYRLAISFGIASVLEPALNTSIHPILWIYGRSGAGKTTLLRAVERAFGRELLILGVSTTAGLEGLARQIDPVPVLMDEAGLKRGDIHDMIFQLAGGITKVRGNLRGTADFSRFRSWAIFTSESPPWSFMDSPATGVFRRIYPLEIRVDTGELPLLWRVAQGGTGWALILASILRRRDILAIRNTIQGENDHDAALITAYRLLRHIDTRFIDSEVKELQALRDAQFTSRQNITTAIERWVSDNYIYFITPDNPRPIKFYGILQKGLIFLTTRAWDLFLRENSFTASQVIQGVKAFGGEIYTGDKGRIQINGTRLRGVKIRIDYIPMPMPQVESEPKPTSTFESTSEPTSEPTPESTPEPVPIFAEVIPEPPPSPQELKLSPTEEDIARRVAPLMNEEPEVWVKRVERYYPLTDEWVDYLRATMGFKGNSAVEVVEFSGLRITAEWRLIPKEGYYPVLWVNGLCFGSTKALIDWYKDTSDRLPNLPPEKREAFRFWLNTVRGTLKV